MSAVILCRSEHDTHAAVAAPVLRNNAHRSVLVKTSNDRCYRPFLRHARHRERRPKWRWGYSWRKISNLPRAVLASGSKDTKVGCADVEQADDIGFSQFGEKADVARVAGAKFQNRRLMVWLEA